MRFTNQQQEDFSRALPVWKKYAKLVQQGNQGALEDPDDKTPYYTLLSEFRSALGISSEYGYGENSVFAQWVNDTYPQFTTTLSESLAFPNKHPDLQECIKQAHEEYYSTKTLNDPLWGPKIKGTGASIWLELITTFHQQGRRIRLGSTY